PDRARQNHGVHARRFLRRLRRPVPRDPDLVGQCRYSAGRGLYAQLYRLGRHRRHLAARRHRRRHWLDLRCHDLAGHFLLLPHLRHRPPAAAAVRGPDPAGGRQHRGAGRPARQEHAGALSRTTMSLRLSRDDRPILIAALFILVILVAGTTYTIAHFGSAPLLSPTYLLQQLQIGSFLGIVAAGMMIVILIAQIDLSVPWTLAAAPMMATSIGGPFAIPVGLGIGLLIGLVNGIGVAYLRVPSMIFTLGVNAVLRGLMVAHT